MALCSISFVKFETHVFGMYIFSILLLECHLNDHEAISFSLQKSFVMTATVSDIIIAVHPCFFSSIHLKYFFPSFHSKVVSVFDSEMCFLGSAKKDGFYFLIQSTSLCLFIGGLRALIFRVIIVLILVLVCGIFF